MPINRNAEHHRERLVEALKEEITALLEGELGDPRIGLCTVSEVLMAPGGKAARVMVEVEGDDDEAKETVDALMAARGYIRSLARDRLGKRHCPELTFHLDRSRRAGGRIEELLGRIVKKKGGSVVT